MTCILIATAAFVVGAVLTFIITKNGAVQVAPPPTCPQCDYSANPDFPRISDTTAQLLANEYINNGQGSVADPNDPNSLSPDARCINFPLPVLKKYIWDLEKMVCNSKTVKNDDLGIRFYYGRYPNLQTSAPSDLSTVPIEYSYRHTLFLVPTVLSGSVYMDYNPVNPDSTSSSYDDPAQSCIMNHGNVTPPPFTADGAAPALVMRTTGLMF
jgi:hypothetical protein